MEPSDILSEAPGKFPKVPLEVDGNECFPPQPKKDLDAKLSKEVVFGLHICRFW